MATDINVVKVEFDIDTKDITKAQKDYEDLIKDIDNTKLSTDKLSASFDKETQSVASNRAKMLELQAEHRRLQNEIKRTGDTNGELSRKAQQVNKDFKEVSEKFKSATQNSKQLSEQIKSTSKDSGLLSNTMGGLKGAIAGAFAVGGVIAFGSAVLEATKNNETFVMSLSAMLKSKEQANILNAQLIELAKSTPFSLVEIQQSTRSLIAMGVASTDISKTLTMLSDVSAGTGNSITELSEKFGRFKTQGRLYMQDVNELTGRGIPVIEEFAKQFGVAESEVRKLIETGKIGFPEVTKALESMTAEGGKFYQLSEQLAQTTEGQLSAMGDSWNKILVKIGQSQTGIFNTLLKTVNKGLELIDYAFDTVESEALKNAGESGDKIAKSYENTFKHIADNAKKSGKDIKQALDNANTELLQSSLIRQKEAEKRLKDIEDEYNASGRYTLTGSLKDIHPNEANSVVNIVGEDELSILQTGASYVTEYQKALTELNKIKLETGVINEQYKASIKEVENAEAEISKNKESRLKQEKNDFKERLALLNAREQESKRLNERNKNDEEKQIEGLRIEGRYNQQKIDLYTEYSRVLTKIDKQTKEKMIVRQGEYQIDILVAEETFFQKQAQKYLEQQDKLKQIDLDRETTNTDEVLTKQKTIENENLIAIYKERNEKLKGLQGKEFNDVYQSYQNKITETTKKHEVDRLTIEIQSLERKKGLGEDEIKIAKEISEKKLAIEKLTNEKSEKMTEDSEAKKRSERERSLVLIRELANTAVTIIQESYKNDIRNQEDALNAQREKELENKNLTESEKEAIDKKYKKLQLDLKIKEFNFDKNMAIANAVINGAVAVTKIASQTGVLSIPLIALQSALTLAQVGAIASRQPPKYFKGTDYLDLNGNKKGIDTIPILAHEGERILPTADNLAIGGKGLSNKELVKLVKLGQLVRSGQLEVKQQQSNVIVNVDNAELVNAYKSQTKLNISMDENGIKKYFYKEGKRTELLNQRYGN
jgi:tape measure domain-containing protein